MDYPYESIPVHGDFDWRASTPTWYLERNRDGTGYIRLVHWDRGIVFKADYDVNMTHLDKMETSYADWPVRDKVEVPGWILDRAAARLRLPLWR